MPELPEVETIKRGLKLLLPGRTIRGVERFTETSFPASQADIRAFVEGAEIQSVERRGKVLIISLANDYSLLVHLKMTGQLVFIGSHQPASQDMQRFAAGHPSPSLIGDLPDKSTRIALEFSDNSHLFFNDQRKFGWIKLMPSEEVANWPFFQKLGPEPLSGNFSSQELLKRLERRRNTSIKAALLDQTVLAGVGNIYADESLWAARIHPATKVSALRPAKIAALFQAIRAVLQLSIDKGGSTDHTYVDAEGKKGSYLHFANVFRRNGQACPRCGTIIQKTRVAGRGTHFCPKCQRLPGKVLQ